MLFRSVNSTAESHPAMVFWFKGIRNMQQRAGIGDRHRGNFGWKDIGQTMTKPGNIVSQRSLKKNSTRLCRLPEDSSYFEVGRKSRVSKATKDAKDGMFLIARGLGRKTW